MNAIEIGLRRIRGWFIAWYVVQSVAGLAIAVYVVEVLRHEPVIGHALAGATPEVTLICGIVVASLLLGLALLLLEALVQRRPWARIVMLVIAWITVIGAAVDLLTVPGAAALLGQRLSLDADGWGAIQAATVVTKAVDLLFWSWVIYVLQFAPALRGAFEGTEPRTGAGCD
jgi:hypothetical protein